MRRLLRRRRIHDRNAAIMCHECQSIPRGRKCNRVNPPSRVVRVFSADGVEWDTFTPHRWVRASIDALDERGKYTGVGICGLSSKEDRVGMPGKGEDGRPERPLDVFRNPPVIFFLEVADSDDTSPRANSKLGLVWRPADVCCRTVNAEKDEGWLPACW